MAKQINQDLQVAFKSSLLKGKEIALGVSGSISAIESVKIIRELRRHQAKVTIFPTLSSLQFITEQSLKWAGAGNVVRDLSGQSEHIFSGDLLVIAPASLNVINKIAHGICDDALTTLAQSVLGLNQLKKKIPLLFFPAMHLSLANNPFLKENLEKLTKLSCRFFMPKTAKLEDKMKLPDVTYISAKILHHSHDSKRDKNEKPPKPNLFITTGAVPSYIDEVRFLSNLSSGKTGMELAKNCFYRGENPLVLAPESLREAAPSFIEELSYYLDYSDYFAKCLASLRENAANLKLAIFTAAVSDFHLAKKNSNKISSKKSQTLTIEPNEKIIAKLKSEFPEIPFLVFKLEINLSLHEIKSLAENMLKNYDYVIVNLKKDLPHFKKYFFSKKEMKVIHSPEELANIVVGLVNENDE